MFWPTFTGQTHFAHSFRNSAAPFALSESGACSYAILF